MAFLEQTYEELLEDERWKKLRHRILSRDNHRCQICGAQENLNVHHRYYLFAHEPWAYYDHALVTLCQSCHKMVHETLPPMVYAQNGKVLKPMKFTPCSRCRGYGYLSEYRHVQGGICFRCKGAKYEELIHFKQTDSIDRYIDQRSEVYDSIEQMQADEAEIIFQKGKSLHKVNSIEAKKYYLLAAKSGYGKAQNNLGLILEDEGNVVSAKRWMLYSAMQGIYQGKSNLTQLLGRTEMNNPAYEHWFDLMSQNRDFQSKIAFEVFAKYLKPDINEEPTPSVDSLIVSMKILIELASEGHDLSKRLVNEYKIQILYEGLLKEIDRLNNETDSIEGIINYQNEHPNTSEENEDELPF